MRRDADGSALEVDQRRGDEDGCSRVTVRDRSPRGLWLVVAGEFRMWASAALIGETWPVIVEAT